MRSRRALCRLTARKQQVDLHVGQDTVAVASSALICDRLRLALLDLKDEDAAIAAAVRVPVCCEHCPVSPDGIGGGEALGLLVVRGRIADELRHGGPYYAPTGP